MPAHNCAYGMCYALTYSHIACAMHLHVLNTAHKAVVRSHSITIPIINVRKMTRNSALSNWVVAVAVKLYSKLERRLVVNLFLHTPYIHKPTS